MTRGIAYVVGCALMLTGVAGLLADPGDNQPVGWALWFAGGVVAHDLVIAPLVFVAGRALRGLPGTVRAGLLVSVLVVAGTLPVLLGLGRKPDNPSILPLPYGRNLLLVLAVVWAATGVATGVVLVARRIAAQRGAVR